MISRKTLALLSICGLLVVGIGVGGTTYALFTGTTSTNDPEVFSSGTINLDAQRDHGDYTPGPMFYSNALDPDGLHPYDNEEGNPSGEAIGGWAPGDVVQRTMILQNEGSLDAKVTGIKATPRESFTQDTPFNGATTVEGVTSGEAFETFIEKAHVLVSVPNQNLVLYEGSLSELITDEAESYESLANELLVQGSTPPFGPGPLNVTFKVTLDRSVGNEIQGKNFIFDFGFYAEQVRNGE